METLYGRLFDLSQTVVFLGVVLYMHRTLLRTVDKAMALVAHGNSQAATLPMESDGFSNPESDVDVVRKYEEEKAALIRDYPELREQVEYVDRSIKERKVPELVPLAEGM